jgi:hypothetical protein
MNMSVLNFATRKFGMSLACTVTALGFAGVAQADFVKTVTTEAECTAQAGDIMDLGGEQHCFVPIISKEFQSIEYAGELRGVTECEEKNVRKSQIGDFCLIKLEAKPVVEVPKTPETSEITDTLTDIAKDEAEKAARKKALKSLQKLF